MIEAIKIISKCAGINNVIDPKWLRQNDQQTGLTDLAEGMNIDIDDAYHIQCRLGQAAISSIVSHSLFYDGGDCFVAQDRTSDTALYQVGTDFSLSGVRSGLTKAYRISYAQVSDKTFYCNGVQNGFIQGGISSPWPATTYYGPDTLNEYTIAPIGTHIAYFMGRMWIAVDNVIYCSEPYKVGLFRLAKCFFQFNTAIRMIRPVAGGVWVSDEATTGFIAAAEKWDGYKFTNKSSIPAHEWSDNQRLVDLSDSQWQVPGLSAVWSSDAGLCIGTSDGQLIVATEKKLIYPTGASGATVVDGLNVINTIY